MKKIIATLALLVLAACNGKEAVNIEPTDIPTGDSTSVTNAQAEVPPDHSEKNKTAECAAGSTDEMCRPVLAEGEGDSVIVGSMELNGKFKIEYYPDGKIAKMMRFDAAQPNHLRWSKTQTYNAEGQVETVTIEDGDTLERRILIYTDGKLEAETGTKKIGNNPLRMIEKKYQDISSTMQGSVYKEADFNHDQEEETSFTGKLGGAGWMIEGNKFSQWSGGVNAMIVKYGQARIHKYEAAMHRKFDMYAYCDSAVGNNSDCDPQSNNFTKHYTVTAVILYQDSDPISSATGIDGDKSNLQSNQSDGVNDRSIDCSFKYYENNKLEPYPLPEEAKKLGLSGKKAIESIECNEGSNKSVYKFRYKPLKDVLAGK